MGNYIIRHTCSDPKISTNLNRKHNEQRKIGKNCDFTLKTEDGGEFKVHKIVLEAASPFFDKMFNSEFNDKNSDSVVIKCCSSSVLEKIVEFMYTGEIEITSDIAKKVLDTGLFLGLKSLVDTCTKILVQSVNYVNCFELLEYSEKQYFPSEALAEKCMKTIFENFVPLKKSPQFLELSIDAMKKLCSCVRSLCNEEQLYSGIIDWIKFNRESREKFISELLDKIQFEKISFELGMSNIITDDFLFENRDFNLKVKDVMRNNWMVRLKNYGNVKINDNSEVPHLYAAIGGKILSYEPVLKPFSTTVTKMYADRAEFGSSTFGDKNLFVCGGLFQGHITNICDYYSFKEHLWKSLPPMEVPRRNHRAVELNDKIYVCGGTGEKTVEIFDIKKVKWSRGPSFDRKRGNIGLCSHNQNIYAAHGGSLQFLDTRSDKWTTLPSLSQRTEGMCSAISFKDLIYVFALGNIFTFDIRGNKWLECSTSYERNYNYVHSACMIDNEIYVFTEFNLKSNSYTLHSYEASTLWCTSFRLINLQSSGPPHLFSF